MNELSKCFEDLQKLFDKKMIIQRELFDNITKTSDDSEIENRKKAVNVFNKCVMSQMGIDVEPDPFKTYLNILGPYTEGFPEEEDFRSALRPISEHISQIYLETESIEEIEEDKKNILEMAKDFGLSVDALRRINLVYSNEIREIRLQKLIVLCQKMDDLTQNLKEVKEINDVFLIKEINTAIDDKTREIKYIVRNEVFGKNAIMNSLKMFQITQETADKVLNIIEEKEHEFDIER